MITVAPFALACPPYTGGHLLEQMLCRAAQMAPPPEGGVYKPFDDNCGSLIKLTIIRNPVAWLNSVFFSQKHVGLLVFDNLIDFSSQFLTFSDFIDAYVAQMPGRVTEIFESYPAHSIIKVEDFPQAAYECIEAGGWPLTPQSFDFSDYKTFHNTITPAIRGKVRKAEREFCDKMGYY